ncbi:MAG: zf-HC2 domain-containing protein [Candidatus Deferrimicrobiaceae bacterium]
MECTRTWDLLSSYLDGDLSDREQEGIADHIRQCSRCAEEERALRETLSLLRSLPAEAAPPELLKRVQLRIGENTAVPLWKKLFLPARIKIPLEAAAVVLVFLLVYGIQKEMPATTPVPSPPASAESGKRVAGTETVAERPVADTTRAPKAEPSPEKQREAVVTPILEKPTIQARSERPAGLAASEPMPERPAILARSELPAGLAARVSTESGMIKPVFPRKFPPGETQAMRGFAAPPRLMRQEPFGREVTIEVDQDARPGVEDRIAAVAMRLGGAVRRERMRIATSRMEEGVVVSDIVRVRIPAVFADVFLEELEKLGSISPEGIPGKLDIPPGPSPDPVAYTVRIRVK